MTRLRGCIAAMRAYSAHPDPLVATANFVALLVASSQPFYPLYLYWTVGGPVAPSFATFLSTPFFLAVPALSRINSVAGRALLPLAGIGNTMLCCKMFGVESGVEMFLLPCALLAVLLFRPSERAFAYGIAAVALLAYLVMHDRYGAPVHLYREAEYRAFARLNFMSAAMLTALVGLMFSNMLAAEGRRSAEAAPGGEIADR